MRICAVRSSRVKDVKSTYSQVFKKIASLFFDDPFDLRKGVMLTFPGERRRVVFGRITMVVADEVALKQMWSVKGSSGTMLCFRCRNLVAWSSRLDEYRANLVPSCQTNLENVIPHTDRSILDNAQYLRQQKPIVNKTTCEKLEQSLGLSFAPEGALWDQEFCRYLQGGPISVTCFDWMHRHLLAGKKSSCHVMSFVFFPRVLVPHFFAALRATCLIKSRVSGHVRCDELHRSCKITSEMIHAHVADVKFPSKIVSKGGSGAQVFRGRAPGSGEIKASASEGLNLYTVLRALLADMVPHPHSQLAKCVPRLQFVSSTPCLVHTYIYIYTHGSQFESMLIYGKAVSTFFLRKSMRTVGEGQVASGFCPHQVMSYNALAAVLDLLVETRSRPVCPDALQAAVQSHLHHRLAAYGAAAFPPKAHYSRHLADQLRRHGALVSLWTHERKQKELKKWANQSHNASKGSSWERGLLEEVVLQQALALEEWPPRRLPRSP